MSHVSAIRFAPAATSRTIVQAPTPAASWLPMLLAMLVAITLVVLLGFGWVAAENWIHTGLDHAAGVVTTAQSLSAGR